MVPGKFSAVTAVLICLSAPALHGPLGRAQASDSKDLSQIEREYDVVVVGGGAGGAAAALQARRLGSSVALLAETGALGGQLLTVPTIDEGWMSRNYPAGIYGELVGRVEGIYSAKGIAVGGCYWDAGARCYESHLVNQELTAMLRDAGVDIYPRARFKDVVVQFNTVVAVEFQDPGSSSRLFGSKVAIDATEFGDVIPRTGAAHFIGNGTGDAPGACVQNITYATPIKYYQTVPQRLRMPYPPPNYELYKPEFEATIAASAGNTMGSYPFSLLNHNIYRATPDLSRGLSTAPGPPKSSVNFANDYPERYTYAKDRMPAQFFHQALGGNFVTDQAVRGEGIGQAKLKTLAFLYYIQDSLGLNDQHWAIADDEFGDIVTADDLSPLVPAAFKTIEGLMPPFPYVRESRRIQAVKMLTADGIRRSLAADGRWRGPLLPTGIAIGDYQTDFHNCNWDGTLEDWAGERASDLTMHAGAFQVPFESFIPMSVDGFLAAEKNLGYSRVASSALRLQPSVLATGQSAGTIAALAVRHHVQPRAVSPFETQLELANSGARLSTYAHDDVPYRSAYWADVQVVAARGIMVGTTPTHFSAGDAITRREAAAVLARTFGYLPVGAPLPQIANPTFSDVKSTDWGLPFVEAIAAHGITTGCSEKPRSFCPDDRMSREQFAVFLVHGAQLPLGPVGGTGMFSDVDTGFQAYVEAVVGAGLMEACAPGRFCGAAPATRGADVARGVRRTLSLTGVR